MTMTITMRILTDALEEHELCHKDEVVHIHGDGSVGHGTDFCSTVPTGGTGIVCTFDPARADDPWDCFEVVD